MEINVRDDVKYYLNNIAKLSNLPSVQEDFTNRNPKDDDELLEFYKNTTSYIKANLTHPIPTDVWDLKSIRVLEFGGGVGQVAFHLAKNGCEVDYIDINILQQDFVKWCAKKHKLDVNVVDTPKGKYDYIILRDVIEHLHDYSTVLLDLFTHLKGTGKIYAKPEFGFTQQDERNDMRVHFHDKYDFPTFMKKAGFEQESKLVWRKQNEKSTGND